MSLWLWISWHGLPGEGLLERAKDEEGVKGGEGFWMVKTSLSNLAQRALGALTIPGRVA